MHEFSIAQNIIEIILVEARKAKAQKVLKVHLRIGDLAQVFPGSLSFCFDRCAKGTILEDAKLTIERVPVRVYCSRCDETLLVENNRYFCKNCGNLKIELVTGRELQINHLEIEDEAN